MKRITASAVVVDLGNFLMMDPFHKVMQIKIDEFQDAFERYHVMIDEKDIINGWTRSNSEVNYPYIGHFAQERPIVEDFLTGLDISEKKIGGLAGELLSIYRQGFKELIEFDPRTVDVKKTLECLRSKGKRLGVFSNDRQEFLEMELRTMGVYELFEYIETSESIDIEKPDPRVFDHIISHFDMPPEQVVYCGDDPVRDIDAAKTRGLKTVWYICPSMKSEAKWRDYSIRPKCEPDAVITSICDLVECIV